MQASSTDLYVTITTPATQWPNATLNNAAGIAINGWLQSNAIPAAVPKVHPSFSTFPMPFLY